MIPDSVLISSSEAPQAEAEAQGEEHPDIKYLSDQQSRPMRSQFEFGNRACLEMFINKKIRVENKDGQLACQLFNDHIGQYQHSTRWNRESLSKLIMAYKLFREVDTNTKNSRRSKF